MYFLIYSSSATQPFLREQLIELLAVSRRNNSKLNVTGLLLYKGGTFMQVLEGEEHDVATVHGRILLDPRHHQILTLLTGPQTARQFGDWSMGFRDLDAGLDDVPGFSEFLNTPLTGSEFAANPSYAQKLLLKFKEIMR
jgi:hypothetical protein